MKNLREAALSSPKVPDDWKRVPIEPTKEMVESGVKAGTENMNANPWVTYKAMLAAAPEYSE